MSIEKLLTGRVSSPLLTEPGPTDEQLQLMFRAALRAPDHGRLRPWRFIVIKEPAREHLGQLFAEAARASQPQLFEDALERYRLMPLRAPVLIALVCKIQPHGRIPEIEQQLSLGAAAQNILHAAYAQGVGAIWRTGAISYHSRVAAGLGLADREQLLGFIYLGHPGRDLDKQTPPPLDPADFVSHWDGL